MRDQTKPIQSQIKIQFQNVEIVACWKLKKGQEYSTAKVIQHPPPTQLTQLPLHDLTARRPTNTRRPRTCPRTSKNQRFNRKQRQWIFFIDTWLLWWRPKRILQWQTQSKPRKGRRGRLGSIGGCRGHLCSLGRRWKWCRWKEWIQRKVEGFRRFGTRFFFLLWLQWVPLLLLLVYALLLLQLSTTVHLIYTRFLARSIVQHNQKVGRGLNWPSTRIAKKSLQRSTQ